jgi:hypothetical protein
MIGNKCGEGSFGTVYDLIDLKTVTSPDIPSQNQVIKISSDYHILGQEI